MQYALNYTVLQNRRARKQHQDPGPRLTPCGWGLFFCALSHTRGRVMLEQKKYPAGSFQTIRLTSKSDEAIRAVEDAATQLGAAANSADAATAHSVLNTARERLARRVADLEAICGQVGTVVRRYR